MYLHGRETLKSYKNNNSELDTSEILQLKHLRAIAKMATLNMMFQCLLSGQATLPDNTNDTSV
jgi:hypothetical protein